MSHFHLAQERCPPGFVDVPGQVAHLWSWFWKLDQRRPVGDGARPVPYADVEAWARMSGVVIRPWELDALNEMDLARRSALTPVDQGRESGLRRSVSMTDARAAIAMFDSRFGRRDD